MFGKTRQRKPECEKRHRIPLVGKILMFIGLLTVIYLFVTEVLMRILAALTP